MGLNAFVAEKKRAIFEDLLAGRPPREGAYDEHRLAEARARGHPQMGSTTFEPQAVILEFIYPESGESSEVLSVRLDSPHRIVFLPVPEWVIESIWQGDIDGSYHFESEARKLVEAYQGALDPEPNRKWFEPRPPKRRE